MSLPRCPNCSRDYVRRSHRRGGWERTLSALYVYPFRCQLCAHRFRAFQPGVRYAQAEILDRREFERIEVSFPAAFSADRLHENGTVTSISMGGCFLESAATLCRGALLQIRFQPPDLGAPLEIETAVVRNVFGKGVGLEFLRFEPTERDRLQRLVHDLLIRQP